MWRRNAFPGNQDSDQSISEEEDGLDDDWAENTISLGGHGDSKGGVQVLSQLELLRDSHKSYQAGVISISSLEGKTGCCIEDEVENPLFNNDDHSTRNLTISSPCQSGKGIFRLPRMASLSHSDEENISDEEKVSPSALENSKENVGGSWSEAGREVEALICLHENSGCSSSHGHGVSLREKKSRKGGSRTKAKPRFYIQSRMKDLPVVVTDGNEKMPLHHFSIPGETEDAVDGDVNIVMTESQPTSFEDEYDQPGNITVQSEPAHKHDSKEHSMAEFLDCFLERSGMLEGSSGMDERGRRAKITPVPVDHESLEDDDDDLTEASDSGPPTPNHNENLLLLEYPQSPKANISRTMAEKFHKAFETKPAMDERPHFAFPRSSCSGLFGKLQQVLQREKERDMAYLNNLSSETSSMDEKTCILVRIMSRSLDAKQTVCTCTCIGDGENSYLENKAQMTVKCVRRILTIIFSPRICSDVELEVGSLVHIHPPWKEVVVKGKDEVIFLCSYYSQIKS